MALKKTQRKLLDLATTAIGLLDQGMSMSTDDVHAAAEDHRLISSIVELNQEAPSGIVHGLELLSNEETENLEAALESWLSASGDRRKSGIEHEGLLLVAVAASWSLEVV